MPIWAVSFYEFESFFEPSRRATVRADTEGAAYVLVKKHLGTAQRAEVVRTLVADEPIFADGYKEH
jgi:hypothetical protein